MTPSVEAAVRPPRPRTVTVAFWLQLTIVLVLLGLVALVITQAIQWDGQIDRAVRAVPDADPAEVRGERWSNVTMAVVLGVPALLLAGWFAATAGPVRRGGNTARILVFVAGGAQLLICFAQGCSGAFVFPLFLATGFDDEAFLDEDGAPVGPEDDPWQESAFFEALYGSTDPFEAVLFPLAGLGVLTVLLLTAAVVLLLALPPAHRWFVPRAAPAAPVPPAAIPLVPVAYPPSPGYYAVPPGYPAVPPGYLICPDPTAHQVPASGRTAATGETGPEPGTTGGTTDADRTGGPDTSGTPEG